MGGMKLYGIVAAAFMAGAFIASPELRAYAAATIGSDDIINESILSEDIKNSQVKASDIAKDAVGASEIQGVTKLIFAQCTLTSAESSSVIAPGGGLIVNCSISGVDSDDSAIAMLNAFGSCFDAAKAEASSGRVDVVLRNECSTSQSVGSGKIGIVVFDK